MQWEKGRWGITCCIYVILHSMIFLERNYHINWELSICEIRIRQWYSSLFYALQQFHNNTTATANSVELSPSWGTASCAGIEERPSILGNPRVHHRVRKSLPPDPILSHISRVRIIRSYLSKIMATRNFIIFLHNHMLTKSCS
jgi:hypothetical protein